MFLMGSVYKVLLYQPFYPLCIRSSLSEIFLNRVIFYNTPLLSVSPLVVVLLCSCRLTNEYIPICKQDTILLYYGVQDIIL